jgi:hypothetical protein
MRHLAILRAQRRLYLSMLRAFGVLLYGIWVDCLLKFATTRHTAWSIIAGCDFVGTLFPSETASGVKILNQAEPLPSCEESWCAISPAEAFWTSWINWEFRAKLHVIRIEKEREREKERDLCVITVEKLWHHIESHDYICVFPPLLMVRRDPRQEKRERERERGWLTVRRLVLYCTLPI